MISLNNILNNVKAINEDINAGPIKKEIGSRFINLFVTTPTEIAALAQSIILIPVYTISSVMKTGLKVCSFLSGSESVKKFQEKFPGFTELLVTIARVVAYTIGTALTLAFGVLISPKINFNLHCDIGLAEDEKALLLPIQVQAHSEKVIETPEKQQILEETIKIEHPIETHNPVIESEITSIQNQATNEAERFVELLKLINEAKESYKDLETIPETVSIEKAVSMEDDATKVENTIQNADQSTEIEKPLTESLPADPAIVEEELVIEKIEPKTASLVDSLLHPVDTAAKLYKKAFN